MIRNRNRVRRRWEKEKENYVKSYRKLLMLTNKISHKYKKYDEYVSVNYPKYDGGA